MKKIVKICITLIIILSYTSCSIMVYGIDPVENPDKYKPVQVEGINPIVGNMGGVVYGMLKVFGVVAAVIALTIVGINFIIGSPEKKADYVQKLLPLAVGVIMLMALLSIIEWFYKTFSA